MRWELYLDLITKAVDGYRADNERETKILNWICKRLSQQDQGIDEIITSTAFAKAHEKKPDDTQ